MSYFCGSRLEVARAEGLEDDAVDDGLDGVVPLLVEAHALGELDDFAVDAGAEALLVEGVELLAELALAAADDGANTVMRSWLPCAPSRERLADDLATICSAVWRVMGRPQLGQWGWPTEA